MKRMQLNLALVAVLLGSGAAMATAKPANVRWGFKAGVYSPVTAGYHCNTSSNICTRDYPAGQNPNINPSGFVAQESGDLQ